MDLALPERFLSKVAGPDDNGCTAWTGCTDHLGYGKMRWPRSVYVHRIAYESVHGEIPAGLVIDHLCRNRSCVNVEHLEAVTQKENCRRGIAGEVTTNRQQSKTHCPAGHPYSGENLYVTKAGSRTCKICSRASVVAFNKRKKENTNE